MQSSSRAPVLSATLRRDSCWIISPLPRPLHDLREAPALRLRERSRLDDADRVADAGGVRLVVRVELDRAADDLLVLRMALDHVDLDDDRLVALVGDDDAAALLAPAALGLRLLGARDRLARLRLLAHGLRTRAARRSGHVLARPRRLRSRRLGSLVGRLGGGRLLDSRGLLGRGSLLRNRSLLRSRSLLRGGGLLDGRGLLGCGG